MISTYLAQSCTITPAASTDAWGNVTPGTPVTVACRVLPTTRRVLRPDGSLQLLRAVLYLAPGTALTLTDTVGVNGTDYTPVQIDDFPGLDGQSCYRKVLLA